MNGGRNNWVGSENVLKNNNWGLGNITHGHCKEQLRKIDLSYIVNEKQGKRQ